MRVKNLSIFDTPKMLDLARFPHRVYQPASYIRRSRHADERDVVDNPSIVGLDIQTVAKFLQSKPVRRQALSSRFFKKER